MSGIGWVYINSDNHSFELPLKLVVLMEEIQRWYFENKSRVLLWLACSPAQLAVVFLR